MGFISMPINTRGWAGRWRLSLPDCRALRPPRLPPQDDAPHAIGRPCGIASGARRAAPAHAPGPGTGPRSWLGGIALGAAALARARACGPFAGAVLGAELCACART